MILFDPGFCFVKNCIIIQYISEWNYLIVKEKINQNISIFLEFVIKNVFKRVQKNILMPIKCVNFNAYIICIRSNAFIFGIVFIFRKKLYTIALRSTSKVNIYK